MKVIVAVVAGAAAVAGASTAGVLGSGPARGSTPAPAPTQAQIRQAIATAERSPALWGTVNMCASNRRPGVIGVRGQMPALGFAATLEMTISVSYYSKSAKRFKPVPHTGKEVTLGEVTDGSAQDGAVFRFTPPVKLEGMIAFTWLEGSRVLGTTTRTTTGGHASVADATPSGYSAATCNLTA